MPLFHGSITRERVEVSFILDAIAKSEHDRQQQEVPDARTLAVPVASEQRPRPVMSYLVVAALLLNLLVLVVWMQSDRSLPGWLSLSQNDARERPGEQAVTADNSAAAKQIAPVNAVDTVASVKAALEIENSASSPTTANSATSQFPGGTEKAVSTGKSLTEPGSETISAARPTANGLQGEAASAPSPQLSETTTAGDAAWVRIEPDTLTKKVQPGEVANQPPGPQDADAVMPGKVTRLSELPAELRRDLPEVDFSGHLYSSNPRVSYVFVNDGRPVFEGQQIVGELFLHKITPSGVIVKFRGYLIEVGVLQNWNLR
jgi:general secretion pathway protein B